MSSYLKGLYIFLFSLLVVSAAGCRANPVYNVEAAAVVTGKAGATVEDVKKAILRAGGALGWTMNPIAPGQIVGTLRLRKHVAVIDIKYNMNTYSIMYKDSTNLDFDGTSIHSNYNGWIQNLNKAIQVQLTTL